MLDAPFLFVLYWLVLACMPFVTLFIFFSNSPNTLSADSCARLKPANAFSNDALKGVTNTSNPSGAFASVSLNALFTSSLQPCAHWPIISTHSLPISWLACAKACWYSWNWSTISFISSVFSISEVVSGSLVEHTSTMRRCILSDIPRIALAWISEIIFILFIVISFSAYADCIDASWILFDLMEYMANLLYV